MSNHWLRPVLLLSVVCLLVSCSDTVESELVVLTCLDQDGSPLPPGVMVSVDGVSEIWSGSPLRFPVKVEGTVRLVSVKVGAGNAYVYNSKSQYAVRPNMPTAVQLRFFRPYRVTVEAWGREQAKLVGAEVFANNQRIGTTDESGRFTWTIDAPNTRVGPARPGTRFDIRLERNGDEAVAAPVILAKEQFTYAAEAYLDQDRVSPYYGFAANTEAAPNELAETPSPARPAEPSAPRRLRTTTPPSATPTPDPPAPITEARPRPPTFETTEPETGGLPAGLNASTPPPEPSEPASAPAPAPTPLQLGDQAFASGRYEEAKRIYSTVPVGSPDFKRARQKLGEIHLETKNFEGAVAAFEAIIREDPSEYAAYNNLAAVYLATESYNEALENLDKVLARTHLIPRNKRRNAELDVRYTRAAIHYAQFQNERDLITKKEQGLLTMSVLQSFIDRVPLGDAAFESKRREMQDKLDDIRQWVRRN